MVGSNPGPFRDQDAITATALGFAGMAMLQSKLFPAISQINPPWVRRLLEWNLLEWWPLLLIGGGVVLWLVQVVERRAQRKVALAAHMGGKHGSGNENQV